MSEQMRTCCFCDHSDASSPDDQSVKCYLDIGEIILDVNEAINCPFFSFDDYFPKT